MPSLGMFIFRWQGRPVTHRPSDMLAAVTNAAVTAGTAVTQPPAAPAVGPRRDGQEGRGMEKDSLLG